MCNKIRMRCTFVRERRRREREKGRTRVKENGTGKAIESKTEG